LTACQIEEREVHIQDDFYLQLWKFVDCVLMAVIGFQIAAFFDQSHSLKRKMDRFEISTPKEIKKHKEKMTCS